MSGTSGFRGGPRLCGTSHRRLSGLQKVAQGPQGTHALRWRHRPLSEDRRALAETIRLMELDRAGAYQVPGAQPSRNRLAMLRLVSSEDASAARSSATLE